MLTRQPGDWVVQYQHFYYPATDRGSTRVSAVKSLPLQSSIVWSHHATLGDDVEEPVVTFFNKQREKMSRSIYHERLRSKARRSVDDKILLVVA